MKPKKSPVIVRVCLCATSDLFEDNKVILKVVSLVDLVLVSVTDTHSMFGAVTTVQVEAFF